MNALAQLLARPAVADAIIARAQRTPYTHLEGYMERFWVFNPYELPGGVYPQRGPIMRRLPSIRVHHILREDLNRHMHDHPWDARTVILRGWYAEVRQEGGREVRYLRRAGDTAPVRFGEFHRIDRVSEGGVWTLFITYQYRGVWGFDVDGAKVPWRKYLGVDE